MQLHFTKMHGCGNDYIYLDCRETGLPAEIAAWSQKLSRRHFSIGADGIICICPPLTADGDATMRMFNADGSEGKMCGNGVRCVAQFLYTHGVPKDVIEIDTLMAGRKTLRRKGEGLWQAEMGHFSAMADTLPESVGQMSYFNANDGTCEGVDYLKWNCFTVQFHPEANGGPKDTEFLFDQFVSRMLAAKGVINNA